MHAVESARAGGGLSCDVSLGLDSAIGNGSVNGNITFAAGNQQVSLCGDLGGTGDISIGVVTQKAPMLNYTATTTAKALTFHNDKKVAGGCEFIATEVTDWSAFAGKSITLVQAKKEIKGLTEDDLKEGGVELKGADGVKALATLVLSDDHMALSLKFAAAPAPVPEPTTGTLSLLALAALAARRRRK